MMKDYFNDFLKNIKIGKWYNFFLARILGKRIVSIDTSLQYYENKINELILLRTIIYQLSTSFKIRDGYLREYNFSKETKKSLKDIDEMIKFYSDKKLKLIEDLFRKGRKNYKEVRQNERYNERYKKYISKIYNRRNCFEDDV